MVLLAASRRAHPLHSRCPLVPAHSALIGNILFWCVFLWTVFSNFETTVHLLSNNLLDCLKEFHTLFGILLAYPYLAKWTVVLTHKVFSYF